MVRLFLLIAALMTLVGLTAPAARRADQPELQGVYRCDGSNPDGSPYRGIVEIAKNHDTFQIRWTFPDRRSAFGIGLVRGNTLSVSYFGAGTAGLAIYKIEEGKRLVGEWTVAGADGSVYAETLTKLSENPRDPSTDEWKRRDGDRRKRPIVKPSGPVISS